MGLWIPSKSATVNMLMSGHAVLTLPVSINFYIRKIPFKGREEGKRENFPYARQRKLTPLIVMFTRQSSILLMFTLSIMKNFCCEANDLKGKGQGKGVLFERYNITQRAKVKRKGFLFENYCSSFQLQLVTSQAQNILFLKLSAMY